MPFINGKFYMNPAYGRAIESVRGRDGASQLDEQSLQSDGAHWVTINGQHVLLGVAQQRYAPQSPRLRIATTAKKHDGSTDWAFARRKDNFGPNTNKCNKFVYDVTKEAGARAVIIGRDGKPRPPLAAEWVDPRTNIANWTVLGKNEKPQPGDVAAYKLPGHAAYTGHSGIVTSVDANGTVHAIAAHDQVIGPDDKFQRGVATFRRYKDH